jgi:hypothetical protein
MAKITKGCYVKTSEIKDTEEWKKVIDAFKGVGFREYEGYSSDCGENYTYNWKDWEWVGINDEGNIYHSDCDPETAITVQEVLATLEEKPTPIEYMFVNDLSINMNQTKEERVSELGEEGWILGGIEPTGTYVFYREKS